MGGLGADDTGADILDVSGSDIYDELELAVLG